MKRHCTREFTSKEIGSIAQMTERAPARGCRDGAASGSSATRYKAANWKLVSQTVGRAKRSASHHQIHSYQGPLDMSPVQGLPARLAVSSRPDERAHRIFTRVRQLRP